MPSAAHEAVIDILHRNPQLAVVLLAGLGVPVPDGVTAAAGPADVTAVVPAELRADAVIVLSDSGGPQLAVVAEVQHRYDARKRYTWPAYLSLVRLAYKCPVVLLVICRHAATARRCRALISTGHPGFDLVPLVLDATTMPDPASCDSAVASPELTVLAVLTGALNLALPEARELVIARLAGLDPDRNKNYTAYVLNAASAADRKALEDLMKTAISPGEAFVNRYLAEGRAEGLAEGEAKGLAEGKAMGLAEGEAKGLAEGEAKGLARAILVVLSARNVHVPADSRGRIMACTDLGQLETWSDRAATAKSVEDVFWADDLRG